MSSSPIPPTKRQRSIGKGQSAVVGFADPSVGLRSSAGASSLSITEDKPVIEGFRITCNGRLQMRPRSKPAEKAESVVLSRGVLPLNSLDQNIDFKQTHATNAYGTIGIKVWIHYISRPI